jgi:hypothetical protein
MIHNNFGQSWATFESLQRGTFAECLRTVAGEIRGTGCAFAVHTTMFVRFDADGRVCSLRTAHNMLRAS